MIEPIHLESDVRRRYSLAAGQKVEALCCPVDYNQEYLKAIPAEVIERDYGCGDPSRHLQPGETVLDLGSGTGKICFIAAQVVGAGGRVIGVDMNDEMLALARKYAPVVAQTLGFANVEFRKGRIQDLALDLDRLDQELRQAPIRDAGSYLATDALVDRLRRSHPLVADQSVDTVVSNCVLNLVEPRAKQRLFLEIFRVLRAGGRAVISDIVSDQPVPQLLQDDPELWSGCISGALTEEGFLQAFLDAGFHGVRLLKREVKPWRTVQGIEFRSVTLEAYKAPSPHPGDPGVQVIYKGPFREVVDDFGHRLIRGRRQEVASQAGLVFQRAPYQGAFEVLPHPESAASAPSNSGGRACCEPGSCC